MDARDSWNTLGLREEFRRPYASLGAGVAGARPLPPRRARRVQLEAARTKATLISPKGEEADPQVSPTSANSPADV